MTTTRLDQHISASIAALSGTTVVVKYGGAACIGDEPKEHLAHDVVLLRAAGARVVVVHGGGNDVTDVAAQLGIESTFVDGIRRTDAAMLDVATMVLAGRINKDLARRIETRGGGAIGLSGIDAALIQAAPAGEDLGAVGRVTGINAAFLHTLLDACMIPVIAPLGIGTGGEVYNINADVAAAAIAAALDASLLLMLSNVDGVIVDGAVVPQMTAAQVETAVAGGAITGGMIPKVGSALEALAAGARAVRIADGTRPHAVWHALTHPLSGTTLRLASAPVPAVEGAGTTNAAASAPALSTTYTTLHAEETTVKKDFLTLTDITSNDLFDLFELADELRLNAHARPLEGKIISMIFQKPSLRTRVSFEVGVHQLGGYPVFLPQESIGIGARESAPDCARLLSRYGGAIVARVFDHQVLEDLARHADVPIINALSDLSHPCQVLADLYTMRQHDKLWPGVKVAFVGDGNNVANSWLEAAALYPLHFVLAAPKGYEPDAAILEHARATGLSTIEIVDDPIAAVTGADVIYTDVWASMGQEEEAAARRAAFADYQVDFRLLSHAQPNCAVMHCLPAHRGEEISADVIDGNQSIVFDQAENRLHVQKALMTKLIDRWAAVRAATAHEEQYAGTLFGR